MRARMAYQCLCSAVKSVSVVSSKLGISSLQRRVSRGLGLLDAVVSVSLLFRFRNFIVIKNEPVAVGLGPLVVLRGIL